MNIKDSSAERLSRERAAALQRDWTREDLERQVHRRWRVGDVYAPHDLSGAEAAKWKRLRRKGKPMYDVLDQLGVNPVQHYKVN
jgi:small subunit ribosomal protein S18